MKRKSLKSFIKLVCSSFEDMKILSFEDKLSFEDMKINEFMINSFASYFS